MSMSDPELDDTTSAAKTGSLGSLKPKSLGSLVQSARGKELNRAKWTLIIVGLIYIAYYGFQFAAAEKMIDDEIQKQALAAAERDNSILGFRLITAAGSMLGLAMLLLGLVVRRFPIAISTIALVLFVGYHAILGFLAPITLVDLWIIKVVVLFGLIKGIRAAVGEQRQARRLAGPA